MPEGYRVLTRYDLANNKKQALQVNLLSFILLIVLIGGAAAGFLLGLTGFKSIVEFLYPAQGYIGIIFIFLIIINFARELSRNKD